MNELNKKPELKSKFDNWGSRCYLFSSELYGKWNHKDHIISKHKSYKINSLDFKFEKLKQLSCDFIISTVEILSYDNYHLNFMKTFQMDDLPYKIYLYEVI